MAENWWLDKDVDLVDVPNASEAKGSDEWWKSPDVHLQNAPDSEDEKFQRELEEYNKLPSALGAAGRSAIRAAPSLAAGVTLAGAAQPLIAPIAGLTGPFAPLTETALSAGVGLVGTMGFRAAQDKLADTVIPQDLPVLNQLRSESAQADFAAQPTASLAGELLSGGTPNVMNIIRSGKALSSLAQTESRPLVAGAWQALQGRENGVKAFLSEAASPLEQQARQEAVQGVQSLLQVGTGAGIFGGQALAEGRDAGDVGKEALLGALFTGHSPTHFLREALNHPVVQAGLQTAEALRATSPEAADAMVVSSQKTQQALADKARTDADEYAKAHAQQALERYRQMFPEKEEAPIQAASEPVVQPAVNNEITPIAAIGIVHDLTSPEIGDPMDIDDVELALENIKRKLDKGQSIDWSRESILSPNIGYQGFHWLKEFTKTPEGVDLLLSEVRRKQKESKQPTEIPNVEESSPQNTEAISEASPETENIQPVNETAQEIIQPKEIVSKVETPESLTERMIPWGETAAMNANAALKQGEDAYAQQGRIFTALSDAFGIQRALRMTNGEEPYPSREEFLERHEAHLSREGDKIRNDVASIFAKLGITTKNDLPRRADFNSGREYYDAMLAASTKARNSGAAFMAGNVVRDPRFSKTPEGSVTGPIETGDAQPVAQSPKSATGRQFQPGNQTLPEHPSGKEDILSFISKSNRLQTPPLKGQAKGAEWDGLEKNPLNYYQKTRLTSKDGRPPDLMLSDLKREKFLPKDATIDDMWAAIKDAFDNRKNWTPEKNTYEGHIQGLQDQHKAFSEANKESDKADAIPAWELDKGDTVQVGTETMRVIDVDPDTGDVTLQDGTKFGRQVLPNDETVFTEKLQKASKQQAQEPEPVKAIKPKDDLLSGRADEPFNLFAESNAERQAREQKELKAENDRNAKEAEKAKAEADKQQGRLFPSAPEIESSEKNKKNQSFAITDLAQKSKAIIDGDIKVEPTKADKAVIKKAEYSQLEAPNIKDSLTVEKPTELKAAKPISERPLDEIADHLDKFSTKEGVTPAMVRDEMKDIFSKVPREKHDKLLKTLEDTFGRPEGLAKGKKPTPENFAGLIAKQAMRSPNQKVQFSSGEGQGEKVTDDARRDAVRRLLQTATGRKIVKGIIFAPDWQRVLAHPDFKDRNFSPEEINGMKRAEGFHDPVTDKVVIITDNVRQKQGETPSEAVERVIRHERVGHQGSSYLRSIDPRFDRQWHEAAALIPAETIEKWKSLYSDLANDPSRLMDEGMARELEKVDPNNFPKYDTWVRKLWQAVKDFIGRTFGYSTKLDQKTRDLFNAIVKSEFALDGKTREGDLEYSKRTSVVTPEQDAAYLKAAESGDMETAQKMVDDAAKAAGYLPHGNFRDGHTAPSNWGASDAEVKNDGADASLAQVRRGIHNQPSDYFDPVVGPRYYSYQDKAGMEALNAIKTKGKTMTVYRAVPIDIKNGSIENRDWVTPSKTYAVQHGESRFGEGKYRIIKENIPAEHLFWDGNDIREWGKDDNASRFYKNTENNIKSADPITRDADGKVIPLSQRFNEESNDIRYSFPDVINKIRDDLRPKDDTVEGVKKFTPFKRILAKFDAHEQDTSLRVREFHDELDKDIKATMSKTDALKGKDKLVKKALGAFIEAGGDATTLQTQASKSTGSAKLKYEAALKLTPEQKAVATKIRDAYEADHQRAVDKGIMEDKAYKDDYLTHIWKQPYTRKGQQELAQFISKLSKNFKFSKQRTLESIFAGEQLGFKPVTDDPLELYSIYKTALEKTIATREFAKDSVNELASDGNPLAMPVGAPVHFDAAELAKQGKTPPDDLTLVNPSITPKGELKAMDQLKKSAAKLSPAEQALWIANKGEAKAEAYFKDRARNESHLTGLTDGQIDMIHDHDEPDVSYKRLDEPALSKWKWMATTPEGHNILMNGELAVHPEIYDHLKNVFGRSVIRKWYESPSTTLGGIAGKNLVRAADVLNTQVKGSMMAFGAFHNVQEGTHAIGHGVNPFSMVKIDPNNADHAYAMNMGVKLGGDNASMSQFIDGLGGGGWMEKIPGVGGLVKRISDFTFHDYIPGLKYQTFDKMLGKNLSNFKPEIDAGKLTKDDIAAHTAEQVNNAYGHLNYRLMGANPTIQHVLRLTMLAPDFLTARAAFTKEAVKGLSGGRAQRGQLQAMATLATVFFVGARIANALLNNGDMKTKEAPFGVVSGNRLYTMRSVPEDIYNAITEPRKFISGRLSPLTTRPAMDLLTGRNYRGEDVSALETAANTLLQAVPLSMRSLPGIRDLTGTTRNNPVSPLEQFYGTLGLHVNRYSPTTELHKMAGEFEKGQGKPSQSFPTSPYTPLKNKLGDVDTEGAREELNKLLTADKLKHPTLSRTDHISKVTKGLQSSLSHPFTGDKQTEESFVKSLTPEQKATYKASMQERQGIWHKYQRFTGQHLPDLKLS